jgi:hypothetical protein
MSKRRAADDHQAMPIYLIEVHMADAGDLELERAVRMLDVAMTRMPKSTIVTRPIFSGHSRDDGRLVCLIEAASLESARRLVRLASLPPGRVREITRIAGTPLFGSHPGGDANPGVDPELVEDVVDVSLDGALG